MRPPGALAILALLVGGLLVAGPVVAHPSGPSGAQADNATITGAPPDWQPTGGPRGGYSRFLVQDPSDDRTVYAAFHARGVWKSTDGGATWSMHSDGLEVVAESEGIRHVPVSALAIAESSPETLFVGTGSGKIYRSIDGADRWELVYQTPDEPATGNPSAVQLIGVSSHDAQLVFAGTHGGSLFVSRDGGESWSPADAGMELRGTATGSIAFDPVDEAVVYFGSSFFDIEAEGRGSGLYKSSDAGRTWRQIGGGLSSDVVNAIAIDPADPSHLVVATGSTFAWGFGNHGLFESTDGGETFEPVGRGYHPFSHAVPYVAFSKHDDRILIGNHPSLDAGVFISDDGGQTWSPRSGLWGDFVTDIVEFDDPDRLLATVYWSGLWLSEDRGATWRPVGRLAASVLHSVYAPGFDPDRVYAAAHSNGLFYSDDRGDTWTRVREGAGGVIHESIIHNYGSSASRFSPDLLWIRGEFSSEVVVLRDASDPKWGSVPVPGRISSVLAHPTERGRAYVGSDHGLFTATYRTLELRSTEGFPGLAVTDLASDGVTVTVGTDQGVYTSPDGGESWIQLGPADRRVTAVAVSGPDVYAAIEGDGVYRSTGGPFERMNDLVGVTQILVDPGDRQTVYFAASGADGRPAVYSSPDGGSTFGPAAAGLPTVPSNEPHRLSISADGMTLYLATVDAGVWKAQIRDDPLPARTPAAATSTPIASAGDRPTDETVGTTPDPSREPSDSAPEESGEGRPESTETSGQPGFGLVAAVFGLLGLVGRRLLRRR